MDIELCASLTGTKLHKWCAFLEQLGLEPDRTVEQTVLIWDADTLSATGSRTENLLKCIGVDPVRQGEGLLAKVMTALRQEAFRAGHRHLFLYTKPANAHLFSGLLFYPVAQTTDVLLMEDRKDGIQQFVSGLTIADTDDNGAVVMNCDPFTLGHQYLVETAAKACKHLYIFVLSEEKGTFSSHDRMEMVRCGTMHLPNVTVLPTGPYLISSATFPTYFLKNRDQAEQIHCMLDVEIFSRHFAPTLHIRRRFVGTEPLSAVTNQYNIVLKTHLPARGIEVTEISRLTHKAIPISASEVRLKYASGDWEGLRNLVPGSTYEYLQSLHQEVTL